MFIYILSIFLDYNLLIALANQTRQDLTKTYQNRIFLNIVSRRKLAAKFSDAFKSFNFLDSIGYFIDFNYVCVKFRILVIESFPLVCQLLKNRIILAFSLVFLLEKIFQLILNITRLLNLSVNPDYFSILSRNLAITCRQPLIQTLHIINRLAVALLCEVLNEIIQVSLLVFNTLTKQFYLAFRLVFRVFLILKIVSRLTP